MQEIETIDLGDKRLNKRCEKLLESFGYHPTYVATKEIAAQRIAPVNEVIKMLGQLGGCLNRKGDREPGAQAIWIGIKLLRDIAFGWQISQEENGKRCV